MEELEWLASLCKKHNVLYISDEVYEWMVYDGKEHIRMGKEAYLCCLLYNLNNANEAILSL